MGVRREPVYIKVSEIQCDKEPSMGYTHSYNKGTVLIRVQVLLM